MGGSGAEKAAEETSQATNVTTASPEPPATSSTPKGEEKATQAKARPEREAALKDYLRVFSYATKWDFVMMVAGGIASIGAGITLPLMNIIFGKLVGQFNDYFTADTTQDQASFQKLLNRQALYIFALFLARFGLNYVNKVRMVFRLG